MFLFFLFFLFSFFCVLKIKDEKDEFDLMVQGKKTLKEKLGTPEEVEKKVRNKKPPKEKDGLKQTKLNFKKKNSDEKGKTLFYKSTVDSSCILLVLSVLCFSFNQF